MTLYPAIPFADGDDLTAEIVTLAFNQVFDDQPQYLGHRARLLDSELSNTPGQIKDRLKIVTDSLKITAVSGLTVSYGSGIVKLSSGLIQPITGNLLVVADNAVSYVWVSIAGTVETGLTAPVIRALLARVTAVSGTVTLVEDLRNGAGMPVIAPQGSSIKSFGGTSTTDYVATTGDILNQGEYYYRNFSVPSGVTITVDKLARIYCSGTVNIAGTVNVTQCATGGNALALYLPVNAIGGGTAGSGLGGGAGELPAEVYNHLASPIGSGGGGSYCQNLNAAPLSVTTYLGGRGGGCFWIEAAGAITVTGTINAVGEVGTNGIVHSVVGAHGGCGGGSGGLILLKSLISVVLTGTSTLSVKGGNGGNNGQGILNSITYATEPGSGGGGGRVVLMAPAINTTGATVVLSGGTVGSITGTPNSGGYGGTGGSFGGVGGHQQPYASGNIGVLITRLFAPVG